MERGASDIHLCADQPPVFRIHGGLERQGERHLTAREVEEAAARLIPADRLKEFRARGEVDFPYPLPGYGRLRANVYRQRGTVAIALRAIPSRITPLHELALPEGVATTLALLCAKPHGLVLVAGPTGSGKSTTLAAMIDLINGERAARVITLEDPIEFLHSHKRSIIHQREVGQDTGSFARGLRAALRQDPDVILVGEMRDLETIQITLEAAETGHLVLATLHTNSAPATVDRIIDAFPPAQQGQVRIQLAGALQGVICQRLFRRRDGRGRVAAAEVLLVTPAVRNMIREGKSHQILSVMQTGGRLGMRTMESTVNQLYEKGVIGPEEYHMFFQEQADISPSGEQATARMAPTRLIAEHAVPHPG